MNRLPTAARRALALDASREANAMIKKWSLRSLANINHAETNTVHQTTGKNNMTGGVSREAAATLLKDVKLRLAGQHARCHELLQEAQFIFEGLEEKEDNHEQSDVINNNDKSKNPKVVKAVHSNWNMNVRHASKQVEIASQLSSDAMSSLLNLEAMHADTYRLVYDLLSSSSDNNNDNDDSNSSSSPVLQRFSSADQALIKSIFEQIRSRHAQTVETMADVVIALRRRRRLLGKYNPSAQKACGLDRSLIDLFLRSRLGVQLLCDHYVALARGKCHGGIAVDCDVLDVLEDAVLEASHVCDANLGVAPEVYVSAHVGGALDRDGVASRQSIPSPRDFESGGIYEVQVPDGQSVIVTLVRPWVHHALVEVLKNAAASSVRKMQLLQQQQLENNSATAPATPLLPPVHVRVIDEPTQVRICIIDRGVGLSSSQDDAKQKAFLFAESAAAKRWDRLEEQQSYAMVRQPLGSLGVGLPLSRMMMQMFGGDVLLMNNNDDNNCDDEDDPSSSIDDDDDNTTGGCTTVVKLVKNDTLEERVGQKMMPVHDDCYQHEHDNLNERQTMESKDDEIRNLVL